MNDRFEINDLLDAYGVLLTEKQQKIADLYFHEDCSYQEIAEDLGRHVKSIDNALQRVKRKLEKYMETRSDDIDINTIYKGLSSINRRLRSADGGKDVAP